MARNRTVVHLDESTIAAVAEHAVQNHSGNFDEAAEALLLKSLKKPVTVPGSKPAKKPVKK